MLFKDLATKFKLERNLDRKISILADNFGVQITAYKYADIESLYMEGLSLVLKENRADLIAKIYNMLAGLETLDNNISGALDYYQTALDIAEENDLFEIANRIEGNRATIYYREGKYYKVVHVCKRIVKRTVKSDKTYASLIDSYDKILLCYKNLEAFDYALKYAKLAFEIAKEYADVNRQIAILNNLSLVHSNMKDYNEQIRISKQALKLNEKLGDKDLAYHRNIAVANNNMGNSYLALNKPHRVLQCSQKSLKYCSDKYLSLAAQINKANAIYLLNDFDRCYLILEKLKPQIENAHYLVLEEEFYEVYHKVLWNKKKYKEAYEVMEKYRELNNCRKDAQSLSRLQGLEYKYENEKKQNKIWELENKVLKKQGEIDRLIKSHENELWDTALSTQIKERELIAQNIHDILGAHLVVSKLQIESLKSESGINKTAKDRIEKAVASIDKAYQEAREVSHSLLQHANFDVFKEIKDLIGQINNSGIKIQVIFNEYKGELPLDKNKGFFLYTAIKEILTNALKHADCSQIRISTNKLKSSFKVVVSDNGGGFSTNQQSKGIGLESLVRKAKKCGGKLKIQSAPGSGAKLTIHLPF